MSVLALLPFYPLLSFLLLISFGRSLSWHLASALSVGAMVLSFLSSLFVVYWLQQSLDVQQQSVLTVTLWHWFSLAGSAINFGFYLDSLSAVMVLVVSGVGLLIHVYAAGYMRSDENFARFMAYMNLFIVAMLILVLADNLVLLYLGWEGVGLCSFLLIGFWYQHPENVIAARKAFIVTRIGDTAMAIGLFLLFRELGELNISVITALSAGHWPLDENTSYWIALLLVGGAVGKSAQLPLQTWLPDAMAGPTPVSALIHAATMVTAGIYLIARMQGVFLQVPEVMTIVAWIGALTLLLAGIAALAQLDIKRVLAYSTMSQIGYMMLALGAGVWDAGIFHLMTHAFFKALLFLTAGSVILAVHHEQSLLKMGGLKEKLPVETALFVIGLVCLMALPGTSGFFSKEAIIAGLWLSPTAGPVLWCAAILGSLLTSIYSCRLFFLAFMGRYRGDAEIHSDSSVVMRLPLILLAGLSLLGGLISLDFAPVFSSTADTITSQQEPAWLHPVAIATPFIGIAFAWRYFGRYRNNNGNDILPSTSKLANLCLHSCGFDALYQRLFVQPFLFIVKLNRRDIIDQALMLSAWYINLWYDALSASQNGVLRWYAAFIGIACVFLVGAVLL